MRFTLLLLLSACATGETDEDTVVESDVSDEPDPDVVRACILEPWFVRTCTGCHFAGSYLDLRSDPLRVLRTTPREGDATWPILVPGDAEGSLLVRKIEAAAGLVTLTVDEGGPMPLDRMIDADDAALVRDWVASGAPDCP